MALKVQWSFRKGGETLKSGEFATFGYVAYEHDDTPTVIFINKISGYHPSTGRQHRYIQCLNLNYLPRKSRKQFVKDWYTYMSKNKSAKLTWQLIKRRYPFAEHSIRRYFYSPNYYIYNFKKLEGEEIGNEVIKNWGKDFSKFLKRKIKSKLKNIL